VSLQVSVTIEGPRARTVVDHVFRNPHDRQLEGTFEYPLPSGASPCYFAMFLGQAGDTVPPQFAGGGAALPAAALAQMTPRQIAQQVATADWGRLQEGRIVANDKALETYEEVTRRRIDPALLEYAAGNTFRGRVFPISPRGYNRVLIAYEELLPVSQGQLLYRFPLPGRRLDEMQFLLQGEVRECLKPVFAPKGAEQTVSGNRITFTKNWKQMTPEGEVVFACTPPRQDFQVVSGRQGDNGPRYVYARVRPQLPEAAKQGLASRAVFLLDTTLSEYPKRFDVSMRLLKQILQSDTSIQEFNVIAFSVGASWVEPKGWLPNTREGRDRLLATLDGTLLEGATDLSAALEALCQPPGNVSPGTPVHVFLLSDGHVTWGEPDVAALVARFDQRCPLKTLFHCYRTGLGQENTELYEALTRKGGGIFQCVGEAEVAAAALAHRRHCWQIDKVRFAGGPEASDVLIAGRKSVVYPSGEIVVAGKFNGTGKTTLVLEGDFQGQKIAQEYPIEVHSGSELAPRAWAEVAVASLLAVNDSNLDELVTAYCQQYGIVSRVASFLILENDADYKQLNLEGGRGKAVAGDLGDYLARMWQQLATPVTAREKFERFLSRVSKRINVLEGNHGTHVKDLLALLSESDFELPSTATTAPLLYEKDFPDYLLLRKGDRQGPEVYLKEARRRAEGGDMGGAVRVLSSILEEHAARSDAMRLVGYRLLDLNQPAQATRLFGQVQRQRPFEPHSYRDFAHALQQSGKYALAAVNYEIFLAGAWHNRFRESLQVVVQEEYARMMQQAIRRKALGSRLANHFGERLEKMTTPQPRADLRVTISWNTDATDVDLWVIEPSGEKCYYQHNRTSSGGELSQDQTQGYGPERYQIAKARPGTYTVLVHYFQPNPNLLAGETHVTVSVARNAGSPEETLERHTVILKTHGEQVEVCKLKF
jgi:hypothetical protein